MPAAMLLLALVAPAVMAHDTVSVNVDPNPATAGEDVTISIAGVEPNQDRVIVLIGQGIVIPFPTIRTDSSGSFVTTVTLPTRLPGGTYRFEAIGDETLTGDVSVEAAAGGIAAQAPADQAVPESRARGAAEAGAIVALALLAGLIGLALVWRAERFRGSAGA
ncbi:MAG: hypothetical protein HY262_00450 [Chloroflexi bacterium]|nr:hypothetical protein [Chloroflexota bacterium]